MNTELTPTQQARAKELAAVMARKFEIQPGDFSIVMVNGKPLLMMTAQAGLDRGTWEEIFDPESDGGEFKVKINDRQVDTRKGMTVAAYEAFVAHAASHSETFQPDSPEMAGGVNEFMRSTLITGEDDGWARYAVNRGKPLIYKVHAFKEATNRRFRPAVILPEGEAGSAAAVAAAIAAKFGLPRRDLGTVSLAGPGGRKETAVLLNTGNGVFMGEWSAIFTPGNDEKFQIDVGGKRIDTRAGMTKAVYEAFIAAWQASGAEPMPDSLERASGETADWCSTFLTGERGDSLARYASWSGKVSIVPLDPTLKKSLQSRFRPAVWLADAG